LVASGEDPAAVARIVAPAGEFIGAQTPEEIALSVLTSVVAARRGRDPQVAMAPLEAPALAVESVAPSAKSSCCGG
jgi:xanthine dehydrogenase accessory factor